MTWKRTRLGNLARPVVPQRDKPDSLSGPIPWLRIEDFDGQYIGRSKSGQGVTAEQVRRLNLRLFPAGTVLCTCSCSMGATAIADRPVVTNQTFIGLVPRPGLDSRYLYFLMSSLKAELQRKADGAIQQYLSKEDFKSLFVEVPEVEEQSAIADFLGDQATLTDKIVAKQLRLLELLEIAWEREVQAVLRLDDSSVAAAPLGYRAESISVGIVVKPADWYVDHGGVPALRGLNVRRGYIDTGDLVRISDKGNDLHRKSELREGDVVVVRTGQAGTAAVVPRSLDGSNCVDLIKIRPGRTLDSDYLQYLLNSSNAHRRVEEYSVGSIQAHYNVSSIKRMPVPELSLQGQREAALKLGAKATLFAEVIERLNRQIALVKQRQDSVVAAAVTGEIDVRASHGLKL